MLPFVAESARKFLYFFNPDRGDICGEIKKLTPQFLRRVSRIGMLNEVILPEDAAVLEDALSKPQPGRLLRGNQNNIIVVKKDLQSLLCNLFLYSIHQ
jgi:hypothetical protein